jgi:spore maturation protein CgeB
LFETKGKNQEVVVFDNECHCKELIDYFLKNEDERMTIARRGMNRVMSQHTYHHRIREIFKILSTQLGNIQNE